MDTEFKITVHNCSDYYKDYRYVVARFCGLDGFWYYGAYNEKERAEAAAEEIRNGFVIETACIVG